MGMKFTPVANGFRLSVLTKEFVKRGNKQMAIFLDYEYRKWQNSTNADGFKLKPPRAGWWKKGISKSLLNDDNKFTEKYFLCRNHYQLPFLRDWNWLIRVVEKIETLESKQDGRFGVYINSNGCTIQGTRLHLALENFRKYGPVYYDEVVLDDKRIATWAACARFLEWWFYIQK